MSFRAPPVIPSPPLSFRAERGICPLRFSVRGRDAKRAGDALAVVAEAASVGLPASRRSPCGASPAHIASLVRAPLRFAKGAYAFPRSRGPAWRYAKPTPHRGSHEGVPLRCSLAYSVIPSGARNLRRIGRCLAIRCARRTPPRTGPATRACPYVVGHSLRRWRSSASRASARACSRSARSRSSRRAWCSRSARACCSRRA